MSLLRPWSLKHYKLSFLWPLDYPKQSSTENNEFISEYGLSTAGSIAAMIGDSDGKISPAEFLESWKRSEVYRWKEKEIIEWLKGQYNKLFIIQPIVL